MSRRAARRCASERAEARDRREPRRASARGRQTVRVAAGVAVGRCRSSTPVHDGAAPTLGDRRAPADARAGARRRVARAPTALVRRRAPLRPGRAHGTTSVGDVASRLARRDRRRRRWCRLPAARAPFVFFDLETTGLSGGAGTYAFLVGCGWFDAEGAFVTEQFLLVDYAAERAMLQRWPASSARAGALVSFNGKSFDAPVLETRYAYNRMESPCADRAAPRRAASGAAVLGKRRELFADRARAAGARRVARRRRAGVRDSGPLLPVRPIGRSAAARRGASSTTGSICCRWPALTARLLHLVDGGPSTTRDAREALALGRIYARAGLERRAAESFEHALALCDRHVADSSVADTPRPKRSASDVPVRVEALRSLALAARRARRFEAAPRAGSSCSRCRAVPPDPARSHRGAGDPPRASGSRSGDGEGVCVEDAGDEIGGSGRGAMP